MARLSPTMSWPKTLALPLVGRNRPSSMRMVVVLPAPDEQNCHGLSTARVLPKVLVSPVDLDCVTGFHTVVRVGEPWASAVTRDCVHRWFGIRIFRSSAVRER